MKRNITIALFVLFTLSLNAQIPVGTFRDHLSYRSFKEVVVGNEYIYCNTGQSLLLLEKANPNNYRTLSISNGLSSVGLTTIHYIHSKDILVVAYNDANLDLIKGEQIMNIPDIKLKNTAGSKAINHLYDDGNTLFISCDFGVVLLDLEEYIIKDTWFTKKNNVQYNALSFVIHNTHYFVSTSEGLFSIATSNNFCNDFTQWNMEETLGALVYPQIASFHNYLLAHKNNSDTIYYKDDDNWHILDTLLNGHYVQNMDIHENELLVSGSQSVHIYDSNLEETEERLLLFYPLYGGGLCAKFDGSNRIYFANGNSGLYYFDRPYYVSHQVKVKSAYTSTAECIKAHNGKVYTVPGSRKDFFSATYTPASVSVFHNEEWKYIAPNDFSSFTEGFDLNNIAINPNIDNSIYVASWQGGVFRIDDNVVVEKFDDTNSPLIRSAQDYISVSGLVFDKNQNLWVSNNRISQGNILKAKTKDDEWHEFSLNGTISLGATSFIEHIIVDSRNYKWITAPRNGDAKVIAFSENNTIDFKNDDKVAVVNMNSSANITTMNVNCIAEDLTGKIWIGTELGVKVVHNAGDVFNKQVYAKNILLEQLDYVQNLLEFETVTAIAVDGANQKWMGTSNAGIFLISPEGTEQLLHFTTENSPLPSNNIFDIAIDHVSGEVFFSTQEGVISYRSNATQGSEDYEDLLVYPNPVRSGYTGTIAVKGLMENAFCKIVDAEGRLIWHDYANGGQLTWNGKDFNGQRPNTGVLFVIVADETGKERTATKIMFFK